MIQNLLPSDDPLLHTKIDKCSYNLDRSKLSYQLHENMFHYNGVGLSANQIGIKERVFVMISNMELQETITCFNPRIVKTYDKKVWCEEGCLSFPDESFNISRPEKIVVKYEDENKIDHKVKLDGFAARVFLHEFDHMEGINFTQRKE